MSTLPASLTALPRWVLWRTEERGGKATKVPYRADRPEARASSSDPATWGAHTAAERALAKGRADGLGFVFTREDRLVGIDLDGCRDPQAGALEPWAAALVERLDSYAEASPSGTGVHVIVRGALPAGGNRRGLIEMYDNRRFFTMTGERLPSAHAEPQERTGELAEVHAEHVARPEPAPSAPRTSGPVGPDDAELLRRARAARNSEAFGRLYDGNAGGYGSRSEADLALCSHLAYWTGGDAERVDRLFRASGLMRDKWERADYREATIARSLGSGTARTTSGSRDVGAESGAFRGHTAFAHPEALVSAAPSSSTPRADGWGAPLPISEAPLADMPAKLFPPFLHAWIEALATAYQVPAELPAGMALSAFSTAVGGRWRVRVATDWYEELSVWMATVLPSGERKSPVVREAKAPIEDHERALALEASDRVAEAQAAHEVLLKRFEKAKGDAAKAIGEADRYAAEEQVSTLAVQVRRSRPPAFPRLLADDATPEALTSLLADHGGVMSVLSAEGGLIDTLAGRYSDGVANLDAVLKAHGGEQIRVDRKGRPPELVERPVLTLGLAVQPTVIEQARDNPVLDRRGFLARFLYLVPTTGLGHREMDPPPVPEGVREDYARRLLRLLTPPTEPTQTLRAPSEPSSVGSVGGVPVKELTLSGEARGALWILRRDVERRLDPTTGDLFCVSAWANKLPGGVVRIAGLLHLAEHGPEGADHPISEAQMARAALIGGTLIEHAKAALGHGGPGGVPIEKLRALVAWIERQPRDRFSQRDAFRGAGDNARFPDMESFRPALAALANLGYVRRLEPSPQTDSAGRPPSPEYAVNPLIGGGS